MKKLCKDCGEEMEVKENRSDDSEFYGCSNYPFCKHTEPLPSDYDPRWDDSQHLK